jgi:hypothetical protein
MPNSSLEELRGKISAGRYEVDSGRLAWELISKFTLIRRVRRLLIGEDEAPMAGRIARARSRRWSRPASSRPSPPRRERLQ